MEAALESLSLLNSGKVCRMPILAMQLHRLEGTLLVSEWIGLPVTDDIWFFYLNKYRALAFWMLHCFLVSRWQMVHRRFLKTIFIAVILVILALMESCYNSVVPCLTSTVVHRNYSMCCL